MPQVISHARNVIFTFLVGVYHLPSAVHHPTRKLMVTYQVHARTVIFICQLFDCKYFDFDKHVESFENACGKQSSHVKWK